MFFRSIKLHKTGRHKYLALSYSEEAQTTRNHSDSPVIFLSLLFSLPAFLIVGHPDFPIPFYFTCLYVFSFQLRKFPNRMSHSLIKEHEWQDGLCSFCDGGHCLTGCFCPCICESRSSSHVHYHT
jgi:hypothetical protein